MTLRRAVSLLLRPWLMGCGEVTFQEWLLAAAVIEDACIREERVRRRKNKSDVPRKNFSVRGTKEVSEAATEPGTADDAVARCVPSQAEPTSRV